MECPGLAISDDLIVAHSRAPEIGPEIRQQAYFPGKTAVLGKCDGSPEMAGLAIRRQTPKCFK